ncbi:hypothetical protein [Microbacterium schleiferi]|uniref:Uncharacterized protein n=1 Tax=Microbacterium schleiferi TaxID=69362 RepID=A0ABU7V7R2_9MICO
MNRCIRIAATATLLVIAGAPLTACMAEPSRVCVPTLTVEPDNPRPGKIVTVSTTDACPLPDGAELAVRIRPLGEPIPLAQARVTPEPDGSFSVSITVPPTIRPGQAVASISNYWDIATCPEGASCAAAEVEFTVAR